MQLKYLQVLNFMTMFVVIAHTAIQHNDCFEYDKVNEEGLNPRKIYRECGFMDNKKVHTNPDSLKCVAANAKVLNEDGKFNRHKVMIIFKQFTHPEYLDRILEHVDNSFKQSPANFYKYLAKGLTLICPKDFYYGNN